MDQISKHIQFCLDISNEHKKIIDKDLDTLYRVTFKSDHKNITTAQKKEEILEYIRSFSLNLLETVSGYEFQKK